MTGIGATIGLIGGSGGLGGAVARRLAKDRPVLVGYRSNAQKAESLVEEVSRAGGLARALQVDLRQPASVEVFLQAATDLGAGLGGVVSVSGAAFPMCALTDASYEEFRDIVDTEVFGAFNLLKAAVPRLKAVGGGPIVLFLTTAVLRTMDYDGMNAVPKAAVAMMLRQVAREAGRDNVRVNAIAPGVIDAGRTDIVADLPPLVQQVVADCLANTPLPRLGRPEEVAALAAHLVSPEGAYLNGQIIALDGGYSA